MSLTIKTFAYLDGATLFSLVADQPWAIFLDSGVVSRDMHQSWKTSFDVLAIKPTTTFVTNGNSTLITERDRECESDADPLSLVEAKLAELDFDGNPDLQYLPGALGYFGYDLARRFERLPELAANDEQLPEMAVGIYSTVVVIDHEAGETRLISLDSDQRQLSEWQERIERTLNQSGDQHDEQTSTRLSSEPIQSNMDEQQYQQKFQAVRDYTVAGDCYQVNLAKRFSSKVAGNAWHTYRALRKASPAPYGAFLNLPFAQVLSNSPESFIQCRNRLVTTSPIKGTMPRDHADPANDRAIADRLRRSRKDRAENLMIVDLMRNDLSRCCEHGTVKVPKLFALHSFANVHHLISTITGKLREELHALDLLRSCFPGGSITGAPKIRAMQIIEELEPHRRGLYCGSIGYVGVDGGLETNIAIRTMVVKDGVARFSAGGGLVIDSQVEQEYQEIIDKARMMTEALTAIVR
ncbi:MAG: aminodeoxychorismate synthase component I [Pseudomonadota bacterium]